MVGSHTTISDLSYRSPYSGNGTSSDQSVTVNNTTPFAIGNTDSGINYYSDYPNDPELITKNPLALVPAFLDWLSRFKSLNKSQTTDPNFFVSYQFTIHQPSEVLTIDNISISNYYSDNPVYLRSITIENGENKYYLVNNYFKLESGFGSSYTVDPNSLPIGLNPHLITTIEMNVYGIGVINAGNGPINWPYKYSIIIPGL
jgi:hypothetical protein